FVFFFQAEDGIRDDLVTGVQTCALPICETTHRHGTLTPRGRSAKSLRIRRFWPMNARFDVVVVGGGHAGCEAAAAAARMGAATEIGRASCREREGVAGGRE